MQHDQLNVGGTSSLTKLDGIANQLLCDLECSSSFLSFKRSDRLVSLGLASTLASETPREHTPEDTICQRTIDADDAIVIEDARAVPQYRDLRYVQDGFIVSYIGVPIRNAELGPVGSVCCISLEPRAWSKADLALLKATARNIECIIIHEMFRRELDDSIEALRSADDVISSFAAARTGPTSIHNAKGGVVFFNRELTELMDPQNLECPELNRFFQDAGVLARYSSLATSQVSENTFLVTIPGLVDSGRTFEVTHILAETGYHVCHWSLANQLPNGTRQLNS